MAAHFKQHPINETADHSPGTNNTLLGTESNAVAEKSFGSAATANLIVQRQANGQITLPAGDPALATDAANKQYVDEQVVSGNTWKEILLAPEQLLNGGSGAVLQGMLLTIATNLNATDFITLNDGTATETWTAVAGAPAANQFQIGGSAAATLTNLVAAIVADGVLWTAVETSGLDAYFSGGDLTQAVIHRIAYSANPDRIYGTLTGAQSDVQVVEFATGDQDYRQASGTQSDLPSGDPAAKRFGFGRTFALLNGGDTHRIADDNTAFTWDSDDQIWQQTAQGSAVVEGDGIDITTNKVSVDTAVATAAQQYGGIVKNRTPDGTGTAGADAGHIAIQTDNSDLEITASNLLAIKALSRLDKYRADGSWTSSAGGDRSPTLAELNAALGTAANDIGNRCMMVEDGTAVASNSTFWAYKKANGGTLTDYHLVEMSEA
jgi:hypothetical protein